MPVIVEVSVVDGELCEVLTIDPSVSPGIGDLQAIAGCEAANRIIVALKCEAECVGRVTIGPVHECHENYLCIWKVFD